jgi:alpha-L-fucosidase
MKTISRRAALAQSAALVGAAQLVNPAFQLKAQNAANTPPPPPPDPRQESTRTERMKWWHDARFGMFIHWGLYSVLGRHEWAMENEAIPVKDYEQLAKQFKPKPNAARDWAKLAKAAGQKYMVMTTKHHEGFCHFNSKLTNYCAPKQGPGRDLVAEFVEAAHAEGLTPGFYYSLMDWHHPDGARCATDEAARRRFVDYIHGQIRELMTNYGKVGVLWYDVSWPLNVEGWESEKMNKMVFDLQPEIIVNNRNALPGDFATPEQTLTPTAGRAWESCMTLNDSWGYQTTDDNWKSAKTVVRNLIQCARDGGNYLLNIGPRGDGSIPDATVPILQAVGKWVEGNGAAIYKAEPCTVKRSANTLFTRIGNTMYAHEYFWTGEELAIGGFTTKVLSAKMLRTGTPVKFVQDDLRVRLIGLPKIAPDTPATTIVVECNGEPKQNTDNVRKTRERAAVA